MKNKWFIAGLTLCAQIAYGLGLGDLSVHSSLNQPFDAEIELLDVGNTPLSAIAATVASPEDFKRVGLSRAYFFNTFTFVIEHRKDGKAIIHVRSTDHISEPYIQMLVDLAWAKGQVYRAYTILLDPPDYQIVTAQKQIKTIPAEGYSHERGVVNKPIQTQALQSSEPEPNRSAPLHYGPTLANESIWQIAQHYHSDELTTQQMILAIVGTNAEAFADGNLNGLKTGIVLNIPTSDTAKGVPSELAELEIRAHDIAWQEKKPILHELLPPYIDAKIAVTKSVNEKTRTSTDASFIQYIPTRTPLLSVSEDTQQNALQGKQKSQSASSQQLKAAIEITHAAMDSIRETNGLLNEQLLMLQTENKRLHQQILKQENVIQILQRDPTLLKRKGIAGQVTPVDTPESPARLWPWFLIFLGLMIGSAIFYWRSRKFKFRFQFPPLFLRRRPSTETPHSTDEPHAPTKAEESPPPPPLPPSAPSPSLSVKESEPARAETPTDSLQIPPQNIPSISPAQSLHVTEEEDHILEYVPMPPPIIKTKKTSPPVKSKKALGVLLDLAKNYATEGDQASAKECLQEVLVNGSKQQKMEAQALLLTLNDG